MGYTSFTVQKVEEICALAKKPIKAVLDLGAQNLFLTGELPAPYTREWWQERGFDYDSIDINGEHGALAIDMSQPWQAPRKYDLVVDAGTQEHVSGSSAEALFNCFFGKHSALKVDGYMYNENPKTGNWPGHGMWYFTQEFYTELVKLAGYKIIDIGEHAAMGNTVDGWNVYCTLLKTSSKFPSKEQFMGLPIMTI